MWRHLNYNTTHTWQTGINPDMTIMWWLALSKSGHKIFQTNWEGESDRNDKKISHLLFSKKVHKSLICLLWCCCFYLLIYFWGGRGGHIYRGKEGRLVCLKKKKTLSCLAVVSAWKKKKRITVQMFLPASAPPSPPWLSQPCRCAPVLVRSSLGLRPWCPA